MLAIVPALFVGGCLQDNTERTSSTEPPRSSTGPTLNGQVFDWVLGNIGDTFPAANEASVTVHGLDTSVKLKDGTEVAAADVEACAGGQQVGVVRQVFLLEVQGQQVRSTRDVEGMLKDNLESQLLEPQRCARGWVAFELQAADEPVAVLLVSSSHIRWVHRPVR